MPTDLHARLTALLARIDQQITEAKALIENANKPVPEWVRANEQLVELERMRKLAEARLRAK